MLPINLIYNCDCLLGLKQLEDNCIDLTITSPPYDQIRSYKGYSFNFENIAKELFRVTKLGGVVVWIVGDAVIKGSETGTSFRQTLFFKELGFNLHDTMIYEKNSSTFPAKRTSNRYTQTWEFMFVFSKGKPKTHNLICDKKNKWAGWVPFGQATYRNKEGEFIKRNSHPVPEFSPRNNIWRYNTGFNYSSKDREAFEHPASFPEDLVKDHLITWSNEQDLVLDPFIGSGTTAKISIQNNRNFIGFEISEEYCEIMNRRLTRLFGEKEWISKL